jgi:hypothetical protein
MTLYAVELKVIGTFSSYLMADSQEDAEQEIRRRAAQLEPDSIVFDSTAYRMEKCAHCGEEHFGPACKPGDASRMKPAGELLRPSWERAQL